MGALVNLIILDIFDFMLNLLAVSETWLAQCQFGESECMIACILVSVHPPGFVQTRTSVFTQEFQNEIAQLFSLMGRSAV